MPTPPTILQAARALRGGQCTPRELVAECLERIHRWEDRVQAWVVRPDEAALAEAEHAAEELAQGMDRGPLHGIPIAIKDIVDVAGLPTRAGSALTSAEPAREDATVVSRLRSAGAIILGKTVTTEFACFDPSPTRNPWNFAHTPGGSSSGSAAAVALGMCLGAIGSQTGGSITRPASYCGIAGVKPSWGRVSRHGAAPVSFHLDHVGPMARTAADCALILHAIAGPDARDPACSPRPNFDWPVAELNGFAAERPPRLGVLRRFFFEEAEAETATLVERTLTTLSEQGAEVVDVPLPTGFEEVHRMHRRLMAAEAADFHRAQFGAPRAGYGPNMAALLKEGFALSMADYQAALRHQVAFRHAMARLFDSQSERIDALVTPATPGPAPASLQTTGDPRFNSPWSYAGVPTASIPCALTTAGLPIALQLIGPAWSEAELLRAAVWCEERVPAIS